MRYTKDAVKICLNRRVEVEVQSRRAKSEERSSTAAARSSQSQSTTDNRPRFLLSSSPQSPTAAASPR
jgi:hypothetical protein